MTPKFVKWLRWCAQERKRRNFQSMPPAPAIAVPAALTIASAQQPIEATYEPLSFKTGIVDIVVFGEGRHAHLH